MTAVRSALAIACGVGSAACGGGDELLFLTPAVGARSAIVAMVSEERVALEAVAAAPTSVELSDAPDGAVVTVLFYQLRLDEMQIPVGPLKLLARDSPSRELPAFDAARTRSIGGGDWRELAALEPPLSQLRIAEFDLRGCVAQGGCFDPDTQPGSCVLPCPLVAPPDPPRPPEPPDPPALPIFLPCPAGWTEVTGTGAFATTRCEPPALPPRVTCSAVDEAQFYGDAGCTRVGSACPAGDYVTPLPTGVPLYHVRPGATGGDGSAGSPYGSIAQAISARPSGGVLALAKGVHDGESAVSSQFTLLGACVRDTVLTVSTSAPGSWIVRAIGADVVVKNLRLRDGGGGALAQAGGDLLLEDVVIEDTDEAGVMALGGSVRAHSVVIKTSGVMTARSVHVQDAGHVELERVVIEEGWGIGFHVQGAGSTAMADALAICGGSRAGIDPSPVLVSDGGGAVITRLLMDESGYGGLAVVRGSTATVSDVTFRQAPTVRGSFGLYVGDQSSLVLERAHVRDAAWCAVVLEGPSSATIADSVLRDSESGLCVLDGGVASASRVSMSNLNLYGIAVRSGRVFAEDIGSDGSRGAALNVESASFIEVRRASIEHGDTAVVVYGTAAIEDLSAADMANSAIFLAEATLRLDRFHAVRAGDLINCEPSIARSIAITDMAATEVRSSTIRAQRLRLERVEIHDVIDNGAISVRASTATVTDLSVKRSPVVMVLQTFANDDHLLFERVLGEDISQTAISIHGPGHLTFTDFDLSRVDGGVHVASNDFTARPKGITYLDFERVRVRDTRTEALTQIVDTNVRGSHFSAAGAGRGIHTKSGEGAVAVLELDHFSVTGCADAALWHETLSATLGDEIELRDGSIHGNSVGLRADPMDRTRQLQRVHFVDNGVNLE